MKLKNRGQGPRGLYSQWKENYFLKCDIVQSGRSCPIFWRKVMLLSQCKQAYSEHSQHCLPGLTFDPEDGDSTFLRNVGKLLPDYMSSHPRTQHFLWRHIYLYYTHTHRSTRCLNYNALTERVIVAVMLYICVWDLTSSAGTSDILNATYRGFLSPSRQILG
jgi:hypothetical protein